MRRANRRSSRDLRPRGAHGLAARHRGVARARGSRAARPWRARRCRRRSASARARWRSGPPAPGAARWPPRRAPPSSGVSSSRKSRQLAEVRPDVVRAARPRPTAVSRASTTNLPTSLRLSDSRLSTVSASVTRSRITVSCSASTSSRREVWRRAGTPRRIASLRSSGRPASAGAELVHDQPEALAVGQAHDVLDQVRRDRGGGLLHRHAAAGRQLAASRCPAGSPGSTRRSATAAATRRTRRERREPKPFSVISTSTSAFCVRSSSLSFDHLAGVGARPRARRRPRPGRRRCRARRCSGARRCRRRRRPARRRAPRRRPRAAGWRASRLMRPGGTWVGSQLKSGDGLNGVERSPVSRSAEPGQRLFWPSDGEAP